MRYVVPWLGILSLLVAGAVWNNHQRQRAADRQLWDERIQIQRQQNPAKNRPNPQTPLLDLSPPSLPTGPCASLRIRGVPASLNWTVAEALEKYYLPNNDNSVAPQHQQLRVGLAFSERPYIGPKAFFSLSNNAFHLFHFLELLVIAYHQLNLLWVAKHNTVGAAATEMGVVPFLYAPAYTQSEICGSNGGINCLILDLLFQNHNINNQQQKQKQHTMLQQQTNWKTQVFGLEANHPRIRAVHETFRGITPKRGAHATSAILENDADDDDLARNRRHATMQTLADAVLVVDRKYCSMASKNMHKSNNNINKIWLPYLDDFPAAEWHAAIQAGLATAQTTRTQQTTAVVPDAPIDSNTNHHPINNDDDNGARTIVIGYVDRQKTGRRLPLDFHDWLVGYLSSLPKTHKTQQRHLSATQEPPTIVFRHLHMEDYEPLQQIQLASSVNILIGGHGNGLSHMLWMPPRSYVLEFFFSTNFQFDYATMAELLHHTYCALVDGMPLSARDIAARNATLMKPRQSRNANDSVAQEHGKEFVSSALSKLLQIANDGNDDEQKSNQWCFEPSQ